MSEYYFLLFLLKHRQDYVIQKKNSTPKADNPLINNTFLNLPFSIFFLTRNVNTIPIKEKSIKNILADIGDTSLRGVNRKRITNKKRII